MSQPYKVKLDATTARELAIKGATLVLLDVPEGTVIGMDQQVRVLLINQSTFPNHRQAFFFPSNPSFFTIFPPDF